MGGRIVIVILSFNVEKREYGLAVAQHEMEFIEAFSWLVQDELDRRRSRLLDRRFTLSGLPERKDLKEVVREIREIRKGASLGGLTIRELINEGRRY